MQIQRSSAFPFVHVHGARMKGKPSRPFSILVVDDEQAVQRFVERVLRDAGYETTAASDGPEAIEAAAKMEHFDLLVTDVMMPQMTGDELARRLRIQHPSLKVLFVEHGFSWITSLLWNLDARYDVLRRESSWVRRLPSEYVLDYVRFTTQPLDMTRDPQQLIDVLSAFEGMERLLCFATDYPHWDADEPGYLRRKLPDEWLPRIFYENAAELYSLRGAAVA